MIFFLQSLLRDKNDLLNENFYYSLNNWKEKKDISFRRLGLHTKNAFYWMGNHATLVNQRSECIAPETDKNRMYRTTASGKGLSDNKFFRSSVIVSLKEGADLESSSG